MGLRLISPIFAVVALLALLMAGVQGVNVNDLDQTQVLGLFSFGIGWWLPALALALLLVVASIVAAGRSAWIWVVLVTGPVLAAVTLAVGLTVLDAATTINEWIGVEGTTKIDNVISRQVTMHITSVDTDGFRQALSVVVAASLMATLPAVSTLIARRRSVKSDVAAA
jgi:hypothetical protein